MLLLHLFFFHNQALQQKSGSSDDEINVAQRRRDAFFKARLNLMGYDGITNYIHMMGAGYL